MSAEAVGMIWVLSWIAQSPFAVPHEVLFDNKCIGYFAAGLSEWVCSWVHERLHKAITSLRQFLQQAGAVLMFSHVHAHQHNPWNSLVDAVARALARGIVFERPLPSQVHVALTRVPHQFAWLLATDSYVYPRPQALRAMFACEGPGGMMCPDPTWIFAQDTAQVQTKMVFELSFASANVLSLSAGSASQQATGLMEIGRVATLQRQFDIAKTNIIGGIQEARTQSPCTRHSSSHLVYQSGADATGVRGCELWLSRSIPYGVKRGKPLFFQPHHVHIASAETRHLLAQIHAPGLQIRLLVVHAPYQKAGDCEPAEWWQSMADLVQRTDQSKPLVVLGDFNARFGSVLSDAISDHHPELESDTGHEAHAFLLQNRVFLPSTFSNMHVGDSQTWISPSGKGARLDFVGLPYMWKDFAICSQVNSHSIDIGLKRHDHFPVLVQITMCTEGYDKPGNCMPKLHPQKLNDPFLANRFLMQVQDFPQVPWHFGEGMHTELLTAWVQQAAKANFAQTRMGPRQRYLSNNTWSIVCVRKQLLKVQQTCQTQIRKLKCIFVLRHWSHWHMLSKPSVACDLRRHQKPMQWTCHMSLNCSITSWAVFAWVLFGLFALGDCCTTTHELPVVKIELPLQQSLPTILRKLHGQMTVSKFIVRCDHYLARRAGKGTIPFDLFQL